jgi:hypothetical protein
MDFIYLVAILLIIILNLRLGLVRTFRFLSLPTISLGLLGAIALLIKITQHIIIKIEG